MKKKLLTAVILELALLGLTGCYKGNTTPTSSVIANKYIDLVEVYEDKKIFMPSIYVYYDKNTKVMYFLMSGNVTSGITPIYNADGSLKLYEE